MKSSIQTIVLLILLSPVLCAQTPSIQNLSSLRNGSAKSVGLSPERLARIDAMAESAVNDGDVPGIVALVA